MQINRKMYQPSKISNKGKKSHATFVATHTLTKSRHVYIARGQMANTVTVATVATSEQTLEGGVKP